MPDVEVVSASETARFSGVSTHRTPSTRWGDRRIAFPLSIGSYRFDGHWSTVRGEMRLLRALWINDDTGDVRGFVLQADPAGHRKQNLAAWFRQQFWDDSAEWPLWSLGPKERTATFPAGSLRQLDLLWATRWWVLLSLRWENRERIRRFTYHDERYQRSSAYPNLVVTRTRWERDGRQKEACGVIWDDLVQANLIRNAESADWCDIRDSETVDLVVAADATLRTEQGQSDAVSPSELPTDQVFEYWRSLLHRSGGDCDSLFAFLAVSNREHLARSLVAVEDSLTEGHFSQTMSIRPVLGCFCRHFGLRPSNAYWDEVQAWCIERDRFEALRDAAEKPSG